MEVRVISTDIACMELSTCKTPIPFEFILEYLFSTG